MSTLADKFVRPLRLSGGLRLSGEALKAWKRDTRRTGESGGEHLSAENLAKLLDE